MDDGCMVCPQHMLMNHDGTPGRSRSPDFVVIKKTEGGPNYWHIVLIVENKRSAVGANNSKSVILACVVEDLHNASFNGTIQRMMPHHSPTSLD